MEASLTSPEARRPSRTPVKERVSWCLRVAGCVSGVSGVCLDMPTNPAALAWTAFSLERLAGGRGEGSLEPDSYKS